MAAVQTGSVRFSEPDIDRSEIAKAKYVSEVTQLDEHQTDIVRRRPTPDFKKFQSFLTVTGLPDASKNND